LRRSGAVADSLLLEIGFAAVIIAAMIAMFGWFTVREGRV
jgi:hypothetical protein